MPAPLLAPTDSYVPGSPVLTISEFAEKGGNKGVSLLVRTLLARVPPFEGDTVFAQYLGEAMADLETALRAVKRDPLAAVLKVPVAPVSSMDCRD